MTRRLTLTILGAVVSTLLIAGLGTIVLATARGRAETESELRDQAAGIRDGLVEAFTVDDVGDDGVPDTERQIRLELLRRARLVRNVGTVLDLDEITVLFQQRDGDLSGDLPSPLTVEDIAIDRLKLDEIVSGTAGSTVFAAGGLPITTRITAIVVLTRQADAGLGGSVRWFLIASVLTIAIGAALAWFLGRRLTRPVREASEAAHRIAAGELSTRLPEPPARASDELAELVRSVNAMAGALERSKALEQQFLLSVSHDLRTPLTSIRGYAEAISDGAGDPQRAAAVIRDEARRLERLVADLLDLATLRASGFALTMNGVDLGRLVRSTTDGFAPDASDRGVRLEVDAAPGMLVPADADRLAQVLANLLENALRFARSTVSVRALRDGREAMLVVEDDGPGIAPQDLPHVFERLYRAKHQPERKESGSGLGLAIVRELTEAMGGRVAAGAAPAGGARFTVRLPLVEP
ncbi:MAG: sensor histidine kinase [Acidimicrobiia bacterium]